MEHPIELLAEETSTEPSLDIPRPKEEHSSCETMNPAEALEALDSLKIVLEEVTNEAKKHVLSSTKVLSILQSNFPSGTTEEIKQDYGSLVNEVITTNIETYFFLELITHVFKEILNGVRTLSLCKGLFWLVLVQILSTNTAFASSELCHKLNYNELNQPYLDYSLVKPSNECKRENTRIAKIRINSVGYSNEGLKLSQKSKLTYEYAQENISTSVNNALDTNNTKLMYRILSVQIAQLNEVNQDTQTSLLDFWRDASLIGEHTRTTNGQTEKLLQNVPQKGQTQTFSALPDSSLSELQLASREGVNVGSPYQSRDEVNTMSLDQDHISTQRAFKLAFTNAVKFGFNLVQCVIEDGHMYAYVEVIGGDMKSDSISRMGENLIDRLTSFSLGSTQAKEYTKSLNDPTESLKFLNLLAGEKKGESLQDTLSELNMADRVKCVMMSAASSDTLLDSFKEMFEGTNLLTSSTIKLRALEKLTHYLNPTCLNNKIKFPLLLVSDTTNRDITDMIRHLNNPTIQSTLLNFYRNNFEVVEQIQDIIKGNIKGQLQVAEDFSERLIELEHHAVKSAHEVATAAVDIGKDTTIFSMERIGQFWKQLTDGVFTLLHYLGIAAVLVNPFVLPLITAALGSIGIAIGTAIVSACSFVVVKVTLKLTGAAIWLGSKTGQLLWNGTKWVLYKTFSSGRSNLAITDEPAADGAIANIGQPPQANIGQPPQANIYVGNAVGTSLNDYILANGAGLNRNLDMYLVSANGATSNDPTNLSIYIGNVSRYKNKVVSRNKSNQFVPVDETQSYSSLPGPNIGEIDGGGTRRHKKRVGAASKHHKKRRRGTKKPSKKRRATRRKRR
jgi:hypothetical protein